MAGINRTDLYKYIFYNEREYKELCRLNPDNRSTPEIIKYESRIDLLCELLKDFFGETYNFVRKGE